MSIDDKKFECKQVKKLILTMKVQKWLTISRSGTAKISVNRPYMAVDEIAILLSGFPEEYAKFLAVALYYDL